jgi:hypothetical protein
VSLAPQILHNHKQENESEDGGENYNQSKNCFHVVSESSGEIKGESVSKKCTRTTEFRIYNELAGAINLIPKNVRKVTLHVQLF